MRLTRLLWALLLVSACDPSERASEKNGDERTEKHPTAVAPSEPARELEHNQESAPAPPSAEPQPSSGRDPSLGRLGQAAQKNFKICAEMCAVTASLRCSPPEECGRACLEMSLLPHCAPELEMFLKCSAEQPLDHFECNDGQPTLLEGHCSGQQQRFFACLQSSMQ